MIGWQEVLAIRLYSTQAHQSINSRLRDMDAGGVTGEFPFPATVAYLSSGIKKLRDDEAAPTSASRQYDLFRGMANLQMLEGTSFMERLDQEVATLVVMIAKADRNS